MARTFYRTVFTVEVLSERPIGGMSLEEIARAIYDSGCSSDITQEGPAGMTGPEMVKALIAQGRNAEFFQLDDDGNDLSEGDDES